MNDINDQLKKEKDLSESYKDLLNSAKNQIQSLEKNL